METNETETLEALTARYADALLSLTITFGVFTVFGFLGNLLVLLVFSLRREYRHNNFKMFVITLGIIDFVTCITLIPAEMVKQRHYFSFDDALSCKVKCFFNVFGASASCLTLLVISIDRFRNVVQPLRKQMSSALAMKLLFVLSFVVPVILAIPGTIMCGIERSNKTNLYGGQTEIFLCVTEDIYRYSIWRYVYKDSLLCMQVMLSLIYIIFYMFVIREVRKQLKTMRRNSSFPVSYIFDMDDRCDVRQNNPDIAGNEQFHLSISTAEDDNLLKKNSIVNGTLNLKDLKKKKTVMCNTRKKSIRTMVSFLQKPHFPFKTIVWFVLTIVFVLTYMTHTILALNVEKVIVMTPSEFSVYEFFFRIYFFNHMINPVVYAIFLNSFRVSCRRLLHDIMTKLCGWCPLFICISFVCVLFGMLVLATGYLEPYGNID